MPAHWLTGWRGRALWCILVAILCGTVRTLLPSWRPYHLAPDPTGGEPHRVTRGVVVHRTDSPDEVTLRVRLERGPHRGVEFTDALLVDALRPARHLPREGQRVFCHVSTGFAGSSSSGSQPVRGQVAGRVREVPLLVLAGVFLAVLGLVGGGPGMRTALSLVIAIAAVMAVLLPLSRAGYDPLVLSVPLGVVVSAAGITLIAGTNRKALSAVVGTAVGATLAGLLAALVSRYLGYTGLAIDFGPRLNLDVAYWHSRALGRVDFAGLLAAGMLISALGATMDVSVAVAAAAAAVSAGARRADDEPAKRVSRRQAALAGLRVGRDMMGLMAAALGFIYLGGRLIGFLALQSLRSVTGWLELMNYESVGADVVRLLAGAIGLTAAIPATALAAAFLLCRRKGDDA